MWTFKLCVFTKPQGCIENFLLELCDRRCLQMLTVMFLQFEVENKLDSCKLRNNSVFF